MLRGDVACCGRFHHVAAVHLITDTHATVQLCERGRRSTIPRVYVITVTPTITPRIAPRASLPEMPLRDAAPYRPPMPVSDAAIAPVRVCLHMRKRQSGGDASGSRQNDLPRSYAAAPSAIRCRHSTSYRVISVPSDISRCLICHAPVRAAIRFSSPSLLAHYAPPRSCDGRCRRLYYYRQQLETVFIIGE